MANTICGGYGVDEIPVDKRSRLMLLDLRFELVRRWKVLRRSRWAYSLGAKIWRIDTNYSLRMRVDIEQCPHSLEEYIITLLKSMNLST